MFHRLRNTIRASQFTVNLAAGLALALGTVVAGGCSSFNLRGESFPQDETFQWSGRVRPADSEVECFGFSNKARQIEQDCGAR